MQLIFIFLGWLIISSIWGFLPVIPSVRQFAVSSSQRRNGMMALSGILACLTGTVVLYWVVCYIMVGVFAYYAHGGSPMGQGFTDAQINSSITSITNQVMLRSTILKDACFSSASEVCEISKRVIENGFNPASMLPIVFGVSIIPAVVALFINKRLTTGPKQTKNDML
jgi:hypothetical protein